MFYDLFHSSKFHYYHDDDFSLLSIASGHQVRCRATIRMYIPWSRMVYQEEDAYDWMAI